MVGLFLKICKNLLFKCKESSRIPFTRLQRTKCFIKIVLNCFIQMVNDTGKVMVLVCVNLQKKLTENQLLKFHQNFKLFICIIPDAYTRHPAQLTPLSTLTNVVDEQLYQLCHELIRNFVILYFQL